MNVKWKYGSPIDEVLLDDVEDCFQIKLPITYRNIVRQYNGGYPTANIFDTEKNKERVFLKLLPVANKENKFSVYSAMETIVPTDGNYFIPFGIDAFGNYLCFDYSQTIDNPSIIFYDHELLYDFYGYEPEFVSNTFDEFLNALYDCDN